MQASSRTSKRFITTLSWLFPATLLLHVVEEYWGGIAFAAAGSAMNGVNLTPPQFLLLTGFGTAMMLLGIMLSRRFGFPQLMLAALGTIVLINAATHTITTAFTGAYNPGVITGLLIWLPLGAVTLVQLKKGMQERQRRRYWIGVAIGITTHAIISLLALNGGKLFGA